MKFLKKFTIFRRLKKINHSQFNVNNGKIPKGVILIEFNSFYILHIIFAYISNFFKSKSNFQIKAYYSHILLSYPIERTLKQKIFSKLGQIFNLGFFGIYKSFGVKEFIFPKIDSKIKSKSEKYSNLILKSINFKKDILKIKISNLLIGDLIYDSYLTRNKKQKPTIDIKSEDFKIFLKDFLLLFFAWEKIYKKNNVKVIICSHSIYTMGIPVRMALKKKAIGLLVKENELKRLNYPNFSYYSETKKYPKIFKKFNNKKKKEYLLKAKAGLEKRFFGSSKDMPYMTKSAFNPNYKNNNLINNKSKKLKILILPHSFIDAPHIAGDFSFADMKDWIKFLAKKSKEKIQYDWFLKSHPGMSKKWRWYQKMTNDTINELISDSKIKVLNRNTTHNQIIKNGIDIILTVFGSPAHEYAYKNIIVINASDKNPHSAYKFNLHCNNKNYYNKIIENLDKIKININKKKVLEFYYMHYLYKSKNWFFLDYDKMLKSVGGYHSQFTDKIYNYWLKNYDKNFKKNFYKRINTFVNSKDLIFSIDHHK